MKIRYFRDLIEERDRLEKSIPKLKQMIRDNIEYLPEIKDSYTFKKILGLHRELNRNRGILFVLNELEKQDKVEIRERPQ